MVTSIKSKSNPVEVGSVLDSQLNTLLSEKYAHSRKIVIVDETTQEKCWPYLLTNYEELKEAELIVLPVGESNKSIEVCYQVWQALSEYQIKRGDVIINLGGGVVTDMGGFIASVYKRGIPFINIPTTLLAMVDASVGGKTGVNLLPWKNQLGVFSLPEVTICDPIFLQTLENNQILSGKAEMIKHGLIADEKFFHALTKAEEVTTQELIVQAVQIKSAIVDRDPKESGERKKLNFGHTVGHAIEGFCATHDVEVTHGACVAWGVIVESKLSCQKAKLTTGEYDKIRSIIMDEYGKAPVQEKHSNELIQLMLQDKKNTTSSINCTLLNKIGESEIDGAISKEEMSQALKELFED